MVASGTEAHLLGEGGAGNKSNAYMCERGSFVCNNEEASQLALSEEKEKDVKCNKSTEDFT